MSRGPAWTDREAKYAAKMRSYGLSHKEISDDMAYHFEALRSEEAICDAFRRNPKVRAYWLGSQPDRPKEKVSSTLIPTPDGFEGTVKANRPRSADEMAEMFDIDTSVFYPTKVIANQWAGNWQTKVFWAINQAEALVQDNFDALLKALRELSPWVYVPQTQAAKLRVIQIPDAHHGALSWGPETGADWDLNLSIAAHNDAFYTLLDCAPEDALICYILGHDLFHYDRMEGGKVATTFKGTPQDSDGRWQKMFNAVAEMAAAQIQYTLDSGHQMHVIVRPGNHDTQTTFYLGKLLEARFWNDNGVEFDVRPVPMQDYVFGKNAFVHLHGHSHAKGKMEKNVKDEFAEIWAASRTFEVHAGHLHHEYVLDENGLLVRGMRALTLNDAWHADQGYGSTRGAQAFDYDYERGLEYIEYYTTPGQSRHSPRKGRGLTS